jgi:ribonuclease HI
MADGACLNNGQSNPQAGWAFFQGEKTNGEPLVISGRLEKKSPWGDEGAQTSNRAELRAVIAALRFRHWRGEGFSTVVVAVDSSYVVDGATQWAKGWVKNGWKTKHFTGRNNRNNDVKNKDLWEILLGEFERARNNNVEIQLWKIPREWNTLADEGAKRGAEGEAPERWFDVMGLAC